MSNHRDNIFTVPSLFTLILLAFNAQAASQRVLRKLDAEILQMK